MFRISDYIPNQQKENYLLIGLLKPMENIKVVQTIGGKQRDLQNSKSKP